MALVPISTRNRVNPFEVSTIQQVSAAYGHHQPCLDPNCQICRGEYTDRNHKHHHKRHHKHHHHRKHKSHYWEEYETTRGESASSAATLQNVELDDRRYYERALIPANRTERQLVPTTRTRAFEDEAVVRESWPNYTSPDDEVVCCRAYNGCRCPCWCCIILIILTVILIIVLIVLLATLL